MDGMKGKSRLRVKVISDLLDCGLFEFACKEGRVTSKEKEKFKHVTDFGCMQRSADLPDIFHHCWQMDHLVWMQNTLRKPKDIEKLGNQIKLTDFDYALRVFTHPVYVHENHQQGGRRRIRAFLH